MLFVVLLAGTAQAATVYRPSGGVFAQSGSGEGESVEAGPVAVDDSTGDVFFASRYPARVSIFAPEGESANFVQNFVLPEEGRPTGMAIDGGTRSLYLSNGSLGRIEKFTIGGTGPLAFTSDPTFNSPTQGSGPGEIGSFFSATLAIDPTDGDLLVADAGNQLVDRYSPSGVFISSFNGADSGEGAFHNPVSIAASPAGDIYVVDIVSGDLQFEGGKSVIERFHSDGTADNAFHPPVDTPRIVAVDPNNGNVLAVGRSGGGYVTPPYPIREYTIAGNEIVDELDLAGENGGIASGLAVQSGGSGRAYLASRRAGFTPGIGGVTVLNSMPAPDLHLDAPENATARTVELSGTVNPLGKPATYHFEYSREGTQPVATEEVSVGEGTEPVEIHAQLTGLIANSSYSIRLVASYSTVTVRSEPQVVQLARSAPEAITGEAPNPTQTTATLQGTVNPYGEQATFLFEYGTTSTYGSRVPITQAGSAGAGRSPLKVSQELIDLQAGTTYHYRIAAENPTGITYGEDRTFATQAAAEPSRVYELVTPAEKGGVNAYPNWMHATRSGNAVTYITRNPLPGLAGSAPLLPRSTSTRSISGWQAVDLNPRLASPNPIRAGLFGFDALAVSEDGTKAVVVSQAKLASGGADGATNLYLLDIATRQYETIATTPGTEAFATFTTEAVAGGSKVVVGGTPDFSRIFLSSEAQAYPFLEGVEGAATYEWSADGLRLVADHSAPAARSESREPHTVSEDGSVVFYETEGLELFAEVDATEDVDVSGPSEWGPGAEFVGASADGSISYYVNGYKLYRFELATHTRTVIAEGLPQNGTIGVSGDGSYVYYIVDTGPQVGLFVWHEGQVHRIAPETSRPRNRRISENGRYLLFGSTLPLTGYANEGVEEFYWYDAVTQEVKCASCRTDGGKPRGLPELGEESSEFEFYVPRWVLNNGEVFFDTPDPLVPEDVNSSKDVYSFDGKVQKLISSGTGETNALFGDASSDGENVFFTTTSRLVKADVDDSVDVYDARIGGGIPGQNAVAGESGCRGAACRTAVPPTVNPMVAGSEAVAGRVAPDPHRTCAKGKRLVKKAGKQQCVRQRQRKHKQKRTNKSRRSAR